MFSHSHAYICEQRRADPEVTIIKLSCVQQLPQYYQQY